MVSKSLCVSHIVISLTYHLAHVKTVYEGAAAAPPLCIILLHYKLVVTDFPFLSLLFFNPSLPSQKMLWFFGNNVSGIKNCKGFSSLKEDR